MQPRSSQLYIMYIIGALSEGPRAGPPPARDGRSRIHHREPAHAVLRECERSQVERWRAECPGQRQPVEQAGAEMNRMNPGIRIPGTPAAR